MNSKDIERQVLSGIIYTADPAKQFDFLMLLGLEHFTEPAYRLFFQEICKAALKFRALNREAVNSALDNIYKTGASIEQLREIAGLLLPGEKQNTRGLINILVTDAKRRKLLGG